MSNKNEKIKSFFYYVVLIESIIILIVGVTYAFYVINTDSNKKSIKTSNNNINNSLSIKTYGNFWNKEDLIPSDNTVTKYAFINQNDTTITDRGTNGLCTDDNGNSVCSVYLFELYNNNSINLNISFNVVNTNNSFENLTASLYEISIADNKLYNSKEKNNGINDPKVDNKDLILVNRAGLSKKILSYRSEKEKRYFTKLEKENSVNQIVNNYVILGNEKKTFALVLHINNIDENQIEDMNGSFDGYINITAIDGSTSVSGQIGSISNK